MKKNSNNFRFDRFDCINDNLIYWDDWQVYYFNGRDYSPTQFEQYIKLKAFW